MSDSGAGQAAATSSGAWQVFTASAVGAYHIRAGAGSEDAVAVERVGPGDQGTPFVLAVADGHGHSRHFRSDRGAAMAVAAAISAATSWAPAQAAGPAPASADTTRLIADVVARWRQSVAADLAADPVGPGDAHAVHPGDPAEIPYGSTLLFGVVLPHVAVLAQIGDGDILVVGPDGGDRAPVPGDSRLDGSQTTSLCQPDAVGAFRFALVDLARTPVYAIFAATDGYGNAQAQEHWHAMFASDLVRLAAERGPAWPGSQLEAWVALCASSEGSGDDSTAALAINTATVPRLSAQPPVSRVDPDRTDLIRPTLPAADGWQPQQDVTLVDHGQRRPEVTLVDHGQAHLDATVVDQGQPPREATMVDHSPPVTPERRARPAGAPPPGRSGRAGLWLVGVVVVIIIVAVVLLLHSSGRSANGGTSPTPSPTHARSLHPTPSPSASRSGQQQSGQKHKHKHPLNSP
jgi:hypothetical protein